MYFPIPIAIEPGIYKEDSASVASNRYIDGNMVRFWNGQPERWAGWQYFDNNVSTLDNPARGSIAWRAIDGERLIAWGTATGLWLYFDGALYDITPADFVAGYIDGIHGDGGGWGDAGWGLSPWGGEVPIYGANGGRAQTWQLSVWGENLIAQARGQKIWEWDYTNGPGVAAVAIANSPAAALGAFVATGSRHLVALGATDLAASNDPLNVRWCDQEDNTTWIPSATNSAGDDRLDGGNEIVGSIPIEGGRLLLTDTSAHVMRFVGGQFVFSIRGVSYSSGMVGPLAGFEDHSIARWMSFDGFHQYDGRVAPIKCDVHRHVFDDINSNQYHKIVCSTNRVRGEVLWFYPSAGSDENDRFVGFNSEGQWTIGEMDRTSWIDDSVYQTKPISTKPDGTILTHETGTTDELDVEVAYTLETGDISPETPAPSAGSTHIAFRKFIPDFKRISGTHNLTIDARDYPQRTPRSKGPYAYNSNSAAFSIRARGALLRFKFAGSGDFRMGRMQIKGTQDGNRQQ